MPRAKPTAKRKRLSKAVPMAGVAGVSLAMAGGASALPAPAADQPSQITPLSHEITLGDEELSDVSLGTFYVFGNENAAPEKGTQLAYRGWGGCGCGCCLSWGGCRIC